MRNHFPVISALLIISQLPYRATYFFLPKTHVFFGKLVVSLLIPKRECLLKAFWAWEPDGGEGGGDGDGGLSGLSEPARGCP